MKLYGVLLIGCASVLMSAPAHAQQQTGRKLNATQLAAIVNTSPDFCNANRGRITAANIVPNQNALAVDMSRVEKLLHGVWRGRVQGNYPKQFLANDGALNVDYYWVIDMKRHEALILEQLTNQRSIAQTFRGAAPTNAPTFSFLMCGNEGYVPRHPRQVHEFQKVSDDVEEAPTLLQHSTGMRAAAGESTLSGMWQSLVNTRYFDGTARFPAFAGGFFKPFEVNSVANATGGPALLQMRYEAEYRGAGATAARFTPGVPIKVVESGDFIGVSTPRCDYLVSSLGNGKAWRKEATSGGAIELVFDKVVIGPLPQ